MSEFSVPNGDETNRGFVSNTAHHVSTVLLPTQQNLVGAKSMRNTADKIRNTLNENEWTKNAMIFFGELIACFLVLLVGGLTIGSFITQPFSPAFGFGIATSLVTVVFAVWGGVHLNMGHTLAWEIVGNKDKRDGYMLAVVRIFGQAAGWFLGAVILLIILSDTNLDRVALQLNPGYNNGQGLLVELIFSFLNTLVFIQVMHSYYENKVSVISAAVIFGLAFASFELAAYTITGGGFNTWRWIAVAALSGEFGSEWWIYPLGHFIGVVAAVVVQAILNYMRKTNNTLEMNAAATDGKVY